MANITVLGNASHIFSQAATNLQKTLPSIEGMSQSYMQAEAVLMQAHTSLQRGTDSYLEASIEIRGMVESLKDSQALAVQRIAEGVDEALIGTMREAGEQLQKISTQEPRLNPAHGNFWSVMSINH